MVGKYFVNILKRVMVLQDQPEDNHDTAMIYIYAIPDLGNSRPSTVFIICLFGRRVLYDWPEKPFKRLSSLHRYWPWPWKKSVFLGSASHIVALSEDSV